LGGFVGGGFWLMKRGGHGEKTWRGGKRFVLSMVGDDKPR